MEGKLNPTHYGNQYGLSIQHYLVKMIHIILSDTDNNSKGEINAVLTVLYVWKEAFPKIGS